MSFLVRMSGTPVADILAHSPPIPLIIDHIHTFETITVEDQKGILLALTHRDCVRLIRLRMHVSSLTRLIAAIDGAFPLLEYLYIQHLTCRVPTAHFPQHFGHHFSTISYYLALPFRLARHCLPGLSRSLLNVFTHPRTSAQGNHYNSFHSYLGCATVLKYLVLQTLPPVQLVFAFCESIYLCDAYRCHHL